MSAIEVRKIITVILQASLIAIIVATEANFLSKLNLNCSQRAHSVAVTEDNQQPAKKLAEEIKFDIAHCRKMSMLKLVRN